MGFLKKLLDPLNLLGGLLGGKPVAPPPPPMPAPAPPPPPKVNTPQALDAGVNAAQTAAAAAGMSGTIATSPQGVLGTANIGQKTLLGS